MNERLFRTQFNQMETTEKQALMESLAARYLTKEGESVAEAKARLKHAQDTQR